MRPSWTKGHPKVERGALVPATESRLDTPSRRRSIAQAAAGGWMMQVARNLLDAVYGFLVGKAILDRGPVYTAQFRRLLRDGGVTALRLPAKSPNLNAHAERYVGSIRNEGLDHVVPLGEQHLRAMVIIEPGPRVHATEGRVLRYQRLGGLLNYYEREAA